MLCAIASLPPCLIRPPSHLPRIPTPLFCYHFATGDSDDVFDRGHGVFDLYNRVPVNRRCRDRQLDRQTGKKPRSSGGELESADGWGPRLEVGSGSVYAREGGGWSARADSVAVTRNKTKQIFSSISDARACTVLSLSGCQVSVRVSARVSVVARSASHRLRRQWRWTRT